MCWKVVDDQKHLVSKYRKERAELLTPSPKDKGETIDRRVLGIEHPIRDCDIVEDYNEVVRTGAIDPDRLNGYLEVQGQIVQDLG
jgi:hypothetical protein